MGLTSHPLRSEPQKNAGDMEVKKMSVNKRIKKKTKDIQTTLRLLNSYASRLLYHTLGRACCNLKN